MKYASVLVILFALIFSSCSKIPINNAEWFLDLGESGADSFWTFSGEERELSKEEWDELRLGMLCTETANYANMIIAIETFCRRNKVCEKKFTKQLKEFEKKVNK